MNETPTELELLDDALRVVWSDGWEQQLSFQMLRTRCPCATCREKRQAELEKPPNPLSIIQPEEAVPPKVIGMRPAGSYGYAIKFNDGHSTGIFTLEFLRSLGAG